jgi:hypothetical protein
VQSWIALAAWVITFVLMLHHLFRTLLVADSTAEVR